MSSRTDMGRHSSTTPGYLNLYRTGELERRAAEAVERLSHCQDFCSSSGRMGRIGHPHSYCQHIPSPVGFPYGFWRDLTEKQGSEHTRFLERNRRWGSPFPGDWSLANAQLER